MILELVRSRRQKYGKPVLIGESGLDARGLKGTLVESPRAPIGLANAIWAAAVSGAMAGRMLWWEDGYRIYPGVEVKTRSWNLAKPVARFVEDVNFAGMKPLAVDASDRVLGGALASENAIIGWFRDARCAAPDWPVRRLEGAEIEFDLPSAESEWLLQFFDTQSGGAFEKKTIRQENRRIRIALPAFQNSVALKMRAK